MQVLVSYIEFFFSRKKIIIRLDLALTAKSRVLIKEVTHASTLIEITQQRMIDTHQYRREEGGARIYVPDRTIF